MREREGAPPPCDECVPPLWEENQEAFRVYMLCRDQLVMGFNGPVAVNHLAIHEAMRLYGVGNPVDCFEKVVQATRYDLARQAEEQARKSEERQQ